MTTTAEQDGTPGTIGVTIKYGKGYEDTWLNARGSVAEVKAMVAEYFGMDDSEIEGLTVSEIVTNATRLAHAKGNLGTAFSGQVINTKSASAATPSAPDAPVAGKPDGDGLDEAITTEIDATTSVEALKQVYGRNKAIFDSRPELLEKWKAHGRKLTGK